MIFLVIFLVFVIIAQGLVIRRMGRSLNMYKLAFSRAVLDTGLYQHVKEAFTAYHALEGRKGRDHEELS